ncbi:Ig-like domain-containing protein [Patescibacteria group bacterium]
MKTIVMVFMLFMLFLTSAVKASVIATEPLDGSVGFPAGTNTFSMELDTHANIDLVNIVIDPPLPGTMNYHLVKRIHYTYANSTTQNPDWFEYYEPRLTFKSAEFSSGTTYSITVIGDGLNYSWSFTTDDQESFTGERAMVSYANPSRQKPNMGMCLEKYVICWQDPNEGISCQIYNNNGTTHGSEIALAPNYYYNINARVAVDMNDNCDWVVGYENDYRSQGSHTIQRWFHIFNGDGNQTYIYNANTAIPDFVANNPNTWAMVFDSGGVDVGINNNNDNVFAYQYPSCYNWNGRWFCDNYIKGILSHGMTPTSTQELGNNNAGNHWARNAGVSVSIPPFFNGSSGHSFSAGCGGAGSAYDCVYHVQVSISTQLLVFSWVEYGGNCVISGDGRGDNNDSVCARVFNPSTGASMSGEIRVNQRQAPFPSKYDQWGVDIATNDANHIWFANWVDFMNGQDDYADIFGRFFDGATAITGEFTVPTKNRSDQYNPSVEWNGTDFVSSWMSNGSDAGGYGIYYRKYGIDTFPIGNDIRANDYNEFPMDIEERQFEPVNTPSSGESKNTWSVPTCMDCTNGSCGFCYANPDELDNNGTSHSTGYSVLVNLLYVPDLENCR